MLRYGGGSLHAVLPLHMQRNGFRIQTHDQPVTKTQLVTKAQTLPLCQGSPSACLMLMRIKILLTWNVWLFLIGIFWIFDQCVCVCMNAWCMYIVSITEFDGWQVRNTGSWMEIGNSISHFGIMSAQVVFVLLLFALTNTYTKDIHCNSAVSSTRKAN